ncbi:MAG: histidine--tRNA ligase [Halobacteriovoraceae bacterium]|nr:histidine--tRNA ligase [Halobacteriovoraceae bacterium]
MQKLNKSPYKGCRDFFPPHKRARDYLFAHMEETAELYAYEPYDGPLLESVDLYKAKSGEELINEQIYSFEDRGERFVAIRPEMTPTLARMIASSHRELPKPIRWYSIPNLMRYEKPQRGRLREHWQFNCDIFGAPENLGELEILCVAKDLMNSLGANHSHFEILINDRRIVSGFFDKVLKITDHDKSYALYKVIDKSKKVDKPALMSMIEKSANKDQEAKLLEYLDLKSFSDLKKFATKYDLAKELASLNKLLELSQHSHLAEYLKYDPTIVRGLDYYTGIVFEIFDKHPDNKRAICGGGAYANLLQIFSEEPLPGVGFGLGDVTLSDFLETHGLMPDFSKPETTVLVTFQTDKALEAAIEVSQSLRELGISCETHLSSLKPKKVFQITEKKGNAFAVFIGEEELQNKVFKIKNLEERKEWEIALDKIDEEFLEEVFEYGS